MAWRDCFEDAPFFLISDSSLMYLRGWWFSWLSDV